MTAHPELEEQVIELYEQVAIQAITPNEARKTFLSLINKRESLLKNKFEEIIGKNTKLEVLDPREVSPDDLGERAFALGANFLRDELREKLKEI